MQAYQFLHNGRSAVDAQKRSEELGVHILHLGGKQETLQMHKGVHQRSCYWRSAPPSLEDQMMRWTWSLNGHARESQRETIREGLGCTRDAYQHFVCRGLHGAAHRSGSGCELAVASEAHYLQVWPATVAASSSMSAIAKSLSDRSLLHPR